MKGVVWKGPKKGFQEWSELQLTANKETGCKELDSTNNLSELAGGFPPRAST